MKVVFPETNSYSLREGNGRLIRNVVSVVLILFSGFLQISCVRKRSDQDVQLLRVAVLPLISYAPLLIADEEQYFSAQGLRLEFERVNFSSEAIPSLDHGDLDVVGGSVNMAVLNAMARGARVRIVADKGYIAEEGCASIAFVIRSDLAAHTPVDRPLLLRGLRVVVNPVSVSGYLFDRMLSDSGLSMKDITIKEMPKSVLPQAIESKSVDLAEVDEPYLTTILQSGTAVTWLTLQKICPGYQEAVLFFGPNLLDKNPSVGQRFLEGYLRGVRQYQLGKTSRNLEILSKRTGLGQTLLQQMCWPQFRTNGEVNLDSLLDYQDWGIRKEYIRTRLQKEQMWDGRFVEAARRNLDWLDEKQHEHIR
jgi:NitT/TauT family transport system substrate-binding protein